MAKFRSEANKAIVEMLKAQQESINEAAKEPEKSESQKKLEEETKKEKERYENSVAYKRKKAIEEKTEFRTKFKSYLVESVLNYVFEHSFGNKTSIMSEDVLNLNKSLVKTFVNEEGVDSLLSTMSTKSNLLAEVAKYVNEETEKVMEEYDETDSMPAIDDDLRTDLYDKLDGSQDFEDVADTIRQRVSLATSNFINKNMADKIDIKDIMNDTKEKISSVRTGDDETDEQIKTEQTVKMRRAIKNINSRPHSVFEQLVINLTEGVISNPTAKERFTTESGKLDMNAIVERAISMYTLLEMVNTLNLKKMDEDYITSVIDSK